MRGCYVRRAEQTLGVVYAEPRHYIAGALSIGGDVGAVFPMGSELADRMDERVGW